MRKSYKYDVAGHLFAVCLPEGFSKEEHLSPYEPFLTEDQGLPLFTLNVELVDDLQGVAPGHVRDCMNDEAPYFWMFEKEGKYNFIFSLNVISFIFSRISSPLSILAITVFSNLLYSIF